MLELNQHFVEYTAMTLEICRICGSTESLKHIFQEGDDELLEQIRLCTNIHIDALDSLPKFVCNACEHGLAFSYRLRKRGEETEKILRQELLGSTNSVPYHLAEDNTNDIGDGFIEDLQEELWIKDELDNSVHFNDDEDFIERIEDSDEGNMTKESCDESEQWIVQDDVLSENDETMKDLDMKEVKEKLEHIKQSDDNTLVKNEFDHTQSQNLDGKNTNTVQIECETCAEVFQTRTKYFQHIKEHGDRRYHCVVCDKWFSRRYVFDQHIQNHYSKTGAFPCQKCDKSYTNHWNLERHARSAHRGEKGFRCGQCNSSFSRSDVLKMHMTKHFTDRNIECDICEKKFKTSQSLHFHKKSHLSKSERPKKPIRIKHKAKTKIELYICDVCEKVSHHRTTHLSHMRTHTGERPYHCSECDKSFKTSHARSSHMLTHTDQRPHECKTCGTSFRQTAHLKSHMLIHEGVKKHVCEVCNKAFRMKCNLIVHSRTHTGELPYKCNKCPKKFIRLTQVKRHNNNHTSANEVQNELCNGNAHGIESDLNNSQISLYVDDIIEISPTNGSGSIVISDCVVKNVHVN